MNCYNTGALSTTAPVSINAGSSGSEHKEDVVVNDGIGALPSRGQYKYHTGPPKISYDDCKYKVGDDGRHYCEFVDANGSVCGKNYGRGNDLKRHYGEHLHGMKPFRCDLCGKQYKNSKSVWDHLKAIHKKAPNGAAKTLKCSVCGKVGRRREDVRRCKKSHTQRIVQR